MDHEATTIVSQERWHDAAAIVLTEPSTDSQVVVLPELGCNIASFRTRVAGRPLDILASPPSIELLEEHRTWYGIPILFPYPGPVHGSRFRFDGREISLPAPGGKGNAMHGFASRLPWRRVESPAATQDSARFRIDSESAPEIAGEWPFEFSLQMTVSLRAAQLRLEFEVENLGSAPMPMGVGLHSYFTTPVGGIGERGDQLLTVSADHLWNHPDEAPHATAHPDSETIDIRQPRRLRSVHTRYDPSGSTNQYEVYSAIEQTRGLDRDAEGGASCTLSNPDRKLRVSLETSAGFRALVLYRPPANESVALEPRSCLPDAFNLSSRGIDAGMIELQPGGRWHGWARFSAGVLV